MRPSAVSVALFLSLALAFATNGASQEKHGASPEKHAKNPTTTDGTIDGTIESGLASISILSTSAPETGPTTTATNEQVDQQFGKWSPLAHFHLQTVGQTVESRPIRMLVISRDGLKRPADKRDDRLVALLVGGIHSGEAAGKEALLQIVDDLAQRPDHPWLDKFILLVVPNFNADGNARRAANRPTQNGPPLTGTRENAQGLDLNRDFMKLDTPECEALVRVIRRWDPHVLLDLHTTNGSHHRYHLTYDIPHHPAVSSKITSFLRHKLLPEVTKTLENEHETPTFFYGNFNDKHTRWTTYGYQGRYGTEYVGLRGRLAILAEAYAYESFETRIRASRRFTETCLDQLAARSDEVRKLLAVVRREAVQAGRKPAVGDQIAIRGKLTDKPTKAVVRGFKPPDSETPHDYEVEYFGEFIASKQVQRPYAYVIPADQTRILRRLEAHGIRLTRLSEPREVEVQTAKVTAIQRAGTFQGHPMQEATVDWANATTRQDVGTVVVRMNQPLAALAANLLEPESDDGLLAWGFFRHTVYATGHVYPIRRIAAPLDLPLTLKPAGSVESREKLTLDQIYGPTGRVPFSGGFPLGVRWHATKNFWLQQDGAVTVQVDAASGERSTFQDRQAIQSALEALPEIDRDSARRLSGQLRILSPQWDAAVWIYANDLFYHRFGSEKVTRLTRSSQVERMPTFSPDGQWLAFVRDRNLFVVSLSDGHERQLTIGADERQFFGELDWVYQEEIYGRGNFKGFWWSPDSRKLALLHLDETKVKDFTVVDHRTVQGRVEVTAYPKSGDPIPTARVGWIDVSSAATTWLELADWSGKEHLISRVGWTPDSTAILAQIQDRPQTQLDLRKWPLASAESSRILLETSPAWVEVLSEPIWLKDQSFLWESHRTGFRHVYRVKPDGQVLPVTSGDWEVRSVLGIDPAEEWLYYQAADPLRRQAFRVPLAGGAPEQLTDGSRNHSVRPSGSRDFFVDYYSGTHQPPAANLCRSDGTLVRTLQANVDDRLKHYAISDPEFMQVPARDGHLLDAMLIKPADFDPQKKYPVITYVYSGPQAPVVQDRWSGSTYLWHQYMAQQGFLIWMCDNRSSSYRSIRDAYPIHKRLGENELRDVEDGLRWLKSKPFVDGSRIGIWGWSYGGYMTGYAMTHSELFRAGIAGAPVTDWRHYDAVYTERYMGLPQSNAEGYKSSSVIQAAKNLHGKLLVVHGTIDDNVHLSNTLQLAQALQRGGKDFDMMLYPGNRHSVVNSEQTRHLRERMTKFFLDELATVR